MRLADTILYKALVKQASHPVDVARAALSGTGTVARKTFSGTRAVAHGAVDAVSRAGYATGSALGPLRTILDISEGPQGSGDPIYSRIMRLRNEQEVIALLHREAERLERRARIEQLKQESLQDAVERASRSPFI